MRHILVKLWRRLWAPLGRRLEVGRAPDARYWCCKNEDNLHAEEVRVGPDAVVVQRRCSKCERRHFRAQAVPKRYYISGSPVGG